MFTRRYKRKPYRTFPSKLVQKRFKVDMVIGLKPNFKINLNTKEYYVYIVFYNVKEKFSDSFYGVTTHSPYWFGKVNAIAIKLNGWRKL